MDEIWKDVPGFPNYQASSHGRIRRVSSGRIMKQQLTKGYFRINAHCSGVGRKLSVHRAVCLAFHGEPRPGMLAAHGDGNPLNNVPSNLRWATPAENAEDREKHGTSRKGEAHWNARLTAGDVQKIRQSTATSRQIAADYGFSEQHIGQVRRGKKWVPRDEAQHAA